MGLLDILKAQGASDADLEAMKPLLSNGKYLEAVEKELAGKDGALAAARAAEDRAKEFEAKQAEAAKYAEEMKKWYEDVATPAFKTLQTDAVRAREEATRLQERIKAAKDYGLADIGDPDPVVTPATVVPVVPEAKVDLPDLSRYATMDTLMSIAEREGEAIAMAADISQEHRDLFGTRLNMTELRKKAIDQKKPLIEVWQTEYKVSDRRAELARQATEEENKKREAWIADIKREERDRVLSELAVNPVTREPVPSRYPGFANKPADAAQNPWEKRDGLRANERVSKVLTTLAKSGVA